jgi:hypothetical protein
MPVALLVVLACWIVGDADAILPPDDVPAPAAASTKNHPASFLVHLRGDRYESDDGWEDALFGERDDDSCSSGREGHGREDHPRRRSSSLWTLGFGREYSLFESPRGGAGDVDDDDKNIPHSYLGNQMDDDDDDDDDFVTRMERYRRSQMGRTKSTGPSSSSSSSSSDLPFNANNYNMGFFAQQRRKWSRQSRSSSQQPEQLPRLFQQAQEWWTTNVRPSLQSLPRMNCRIEPTTTLKLRKTFRPLKTIIRLGADFNTHLGVWQFKSSWEDAIIGGKLTLAGRELQLTKSWQLSVGAVEDLVTRLRFRAAIDLQTFQAYARVGFRTERLTPINVVEGFTIWKRIPLDGKGGNIKLEVKANVALPEPEIEYSTETQRRSLIGMGDIEVSVDEMNLLLDY